MTFDNDKKMHLEKDDKSIKGNIDEHIAALCNIINSKKNFYTTSSCSGRIAIYRLPDSGKKNETEWLFITHDEATLTEIMKHLENLPEEDVWFRFEPLIIHVAARTLDDAAMLLKLVQSVGMKRAGIIAVGERYVLEIIGTERIDTVIAKQGDLLVDEGYLQVLVEDANSKMVKNWNNIMKLGKEMSKLV